jgi:hypothetical protein
MSQELDAKKHVIIGILGRLRDYNTSIGNYERSVLNSEFQYSVQLTNGRILLSEEIVYDYEKNPTSVSGDRFESHSRRFMPTILENPNVPKPIVTDTQTPLKNKSSGKNIFTIFLLAILVIIAYFGYTAWQKSNETEMAKLNAKVNIYDLVSVEGSNYTVNELIGGISGLNITVTNSSDYMADIVKVKVIYLKKNGEKYKTEMLYFNKVSSHSTQTLPAPDSDRGIRVEIFTESISSAELGV